MGGIQIFCVISPKSYKNFFDKLSSGKIYILPLLISIKGKSWERLQLQLLLMHFLLS